MSDSVPEPWLRGTKLDVHPLVAPVLFSFQQAREDVAKYSARLTNDQLWMRPHGFGAAGFHIRHMGGAAERLSTYLSSAELTSEQMQQLHRQEEPGASREELLAELERNFAAAERKLRDADLSDPGALRTVGRKRLPTTVAGLLVHIAEHTQRHVGQAISACKLAQAGG